MRTTKRTIRMSTIAINSSSSAIENSACSVIEPWVADSGEGRWTVTEAMDLNLPAPVITLALEQRLRSREADPFAEKLLAMMRNKFGGHAVRTEP